jgi:iron(II)-dependent oxidoreductase
MVSPMTQWKLGSQFVRRVEARQRWFLAVLCGVSLWLVLSACQADFTPSLAEPTPIAQNDDWVVVSQTVNGVEMVKVPRGCFTMGHHLGRRDEQPEHHICFEKPFWIDRYEVTNTQFGAAGAFAGDLHPRENLTWAEAYEFCLGRGARLPSEAEWEYAARGPDSWLYPWGNRLIDANLVFDRNSNSQTAPVGSRPGGVSWVGAYDLAGNVWEWVSSLYRPYPYDATDGREDPTNRSEWRVFRGGLGSYIDFGPSSATRFRAYPDQRDWFIGFRCAKDE